MEETKIRWYWSQGGTLESGPWVCFELAHSTAEAVADKTKHVDIIECTIRGSVREQREHTRFRFDNGKLVVDTEGGDAPVAE